MDAGILFLRLLVGCLMAGHALQKLFGWFDGHGIAGTAPLFAQWGLRPARPMVAIAGASELAGAVLIASGTFTAVGVAFVVGTMLVAGSVNAANGLWAVGGGYELPLVYGLMGLGIGLVGPGRYSVDAHTQLERFTGSGYVLAAAAAAIICSAPLVVRIVRTRRGSISSPPERRTSDEPGAMHHA